MKYTSLTLQRDSKNDDRTFGVLSDAEGTICQTLEPGNKSGTGKGPIPAGRYVAFLRFSPKRGYAVFGLLDTPHFQDIEIHPGNTQYNTIGCILLGDSRGKLFVHDRNLDAVLNSRDTLGRFMRDQGVPNYRELTNWDKVQNFNLKNPHSFVIEIKDIAVDKNTIKAASTKATKEPEKLSQEAPVSDTVSPS